MIIMWLISFFFFFFFFWCSNKKQRGNIWKNIEKENNNDFTTWNVLIRKCVNVLI